MEPSYERQEGTLRVNMVKEVFAGTYRLPECHPERSEGSARMQSLQFSVYILANVNRRLYVGITRDLAAGYFQHKVGTFPGFSRHYGITRLVYVETTRNGRDAIAREKQIKGWLRWKKVALIEAVNPAWENLAKKWFEAGGQADPSLRSG